MLILGCANVAPQLELTGQFAERQQLGVVELDILDEISGLAASQNNAGVLWAHNDSGDGSNIYAMTETGQHLATFNVEGCWALDWEDIALGRGPKEGVDYLYIGDIGDNRAIRPFIQICRVAEPTIEQLQSGVPTLQGEVITLHYPGGARDAESLMVDAVNGLYIVTKREANVSVFFAPYPHSLTESILLTEVAVLPLRWITAGDLSYDGQELLLKTSKKVFYWRRMPGESLVSMLQRTPSMVKSYQKEVQGEAIAWARDAQGFYTASEEVRGLEAKVNYYPRLNNKQ